MIIESGSECTEEQEKCAYRRPGNQRRKRREDKFICPDELITKRASRVRINCCSAPPSNTDSKQLKGNMQDKTKKNKKEGKTKARDLKPAKDAKGGGTGGTRGPGGPLGPTGNK